MKESITTVQVSRKNRDRLAAFGRAGESLDNALSRILDVVDVIWLSDPAAPEKYMGVKKCIDVAESDWRAWLMVDGSIVSPPPEEIT